MFVYESLDESDKGLIDEEIESYIKHMVVNNRGFDYTDGEFNAMLYEIILHGEQTNGFLGGNDLPSFSLKETVVKSRAIKIAYELEQYRPSKDLIEFYIGLCKDLNIEPITDILFDMSFANRLVHSLSINRSKQNGGLLTSSEKHVDIQCETNYNKSNKIILFESLVRDFYKDTDQNSKPCSSH